MGYRSMQSQFRYVIQESQHFGESKRDARLNGVSTEDKIYSYSTNNNMFDTAYDFAKFLKEEYKEVKSVADIKANHVQAYVDTKIPTCSQATVKQIVSRLGKLETMSQAVFKGSNIEFMKNEIKTSHTQEQSKASKVRCLVVSNADYKKIMSTETKGEWKYSAEMSRVFGLRASETVKLRSMDIKDNCLQIIGSKGGRDREVPIRTAEQKELAERLKNYSVSKGQTDRESILSIKAESASRGISNAMKANGLEKYTQAKTSNHALRKAYAIERYEEITGHKLKPNDKIDIKSWDIVSKELGHGEGRSALAHAYLNV